MIFLGLFFYYFRILSGFLSRGKVLTYINRFSDFFSSQLAFKCENWVMLSPSNRTFINKIALYWYSGARDVTEVRGFSWGRGEWECPDQRRRRGEERCAVVSIAHVGCKQPVRRWEDERVNAKSNGGISTGLQSERDRTVATLSLWLPIAS